MVTFKKYYVDKSRKSKESHVARYNVAKSKHSALIWSILAVRHALTINLEH